MKNSPLTTVLLLLILASALASLFYCWSLINKSRELRNLQAEVNRINYRGAAIQALANDAYEYSKKNPAIEPILESAGFKKAATNGTARPSSK